MEEYLAPIYRSESRFVIVLFSKEYPNKIWAKFESDQFKQRFGEGAIISVWYADAVPGAFDESKRVGGMAFDPRADLASQVQEIVQVLGAKLEEERQVEVKNSDVAAVDSA